jgi:hypothetical protein
MSLVIGEAARPGKAFYAIGYELDHDAWGSLQPEVPQRVTLLRRSPAEPDCCYGVAGAAASEVPVQRRFFEKVGTFLR